MKCKHNNPDKYMVLSYLSTTKTIWDTIKWCSYCGCIKFQNEKRWRIPESQNKKYTQLFRRRIRTE